MKFKKTEKIPNRSKTRIQTKHQGQKYQNQKRNKIKRPRKNYAVQINKVYRISNPDLALLLCYLKCIKMEMFGIAVDLRYRMKQITEDN